jgi:hypothetical protein
MFNLLLPFGFSGVLGGWLPIILECDFALNGDILADVMAGGFSTAFWSVGCNGFLDLGVCNIECVFVF